jgi:hypothetical protein
MRGIALVGLCAATVTLAFSTSAEADVFGPISLLSATAAEQADYAHDPAVSGNGEYVVFDGSIDGVTGVWRRELGGSHTVVQVAGGDAELPSVSENGQYVSFTTNEGGHLPEITNEGIDPQSEVTESPNVYVRNMDVGPTALGAFTVVSAPTGSVEPLTYSYPGGPEDVPVYGATAVGRSAISADGQKVVFMTTAISDLTDPETPGQPDTPPLQVAVRDLETDTTELVTVKDDPVTGRPETNEQGQPVPVPLVGATGNERGAVATEGRVPRFNSVPAYTATPQAGASISADGSSVAWLAQNLSDQLQTLPNEPLDPEYTEPVWRRIGEGEGAVTRAVTGGADLADPECAADPEARLPQTPSSSDPCQGPFDGNAGELEGTGISGAMPLNQLDAVPRLSANGYHVAFLADAPLVSLGQGFGVHHSDLYVSDMEGSLPRVQALTPLTELASGNETQIATTAQIADFDISPDGQQVAFSTKRTVFPLTSINYVSTPAAVPGLAELFDVDLANDTLTRVTHGYEGGPSKLPLASEEGEDPYKVAEGEGALSPSFSDSGNTLVFSSTASNLVYGDGNTPPFDSPLNLDGSDVFAVGREVFAPEPTPQSISPAPPAPSLEPLWSLAVSASEMSDGSLRLYVELPGAGTLRVAAQGGVAVVAHASRRRHSRAHTTVLTRTFASLLSEVAPDGEGLTTLVLKLAPNYISLATRKGGLLANVSIAFSAPGHATLKDSFTASFVRKLPAHKARVSARAHGTRR